MTHLKGRLEARNVRTGLIDQGLKFRGMGRAALNMRQPLDSPATLDAFLRTEKAQAATLDLLAEAAAMSDADRKAFLYSPEVSTASGKVGKVQASHAIAVGLLRAEITEAVEAETDVLLVDGRSIEKYARELEKENLVRFVMGWFFKCDPVIAARRSLGIFAPRTELTDEQKIQLFDEAANISDRNRSDTQRSVDPLCEPERAYRLDLSTYGQPESLTPHGIAYDTLHRGGMAIVDTSYTRDVIEMTEPVTAISMMALHHRGPLVAADVGMA